MTLPVAIGQRFGTLTVLEIRSRGQNNSRATKCICDCGETRDTNISMLTRGHVSRCRKCTNPRLDPAEKKLRHSHLTYKNGAARRGYEWALTPEKFRELFSSECAYCGLEPAQGVDRKDNRKGYTIHNAVSCCKQCNLAKRDMSETEFYLWLRRIVAHKGIWLT